MILDPEIFFTLDPEFFLYSGSWFRVGKNSDPGFGIYIPDQQHRILLFHRKVSSLEYILHKKGTSFMSVSTLNPPVSFNRPGTKKGWKHEMVSFI